jgi:putative DNA primase/helicase
MSDPFAPLGSGAALSASKRSAWSIVMPAPAGAPRPPAAHFKIGAPTAKWPYHDAGGALLGFVLRFDGDGGEKQFRPLTLWKSSADKLEWRWESWPPKRPLYGLQALAERPSAPVLVTEGEKAADAATRLLPEFVAVTSPNGSKSASKADWSPLRAREVIIWPDADAAGLEYANAVAKFLGAVGAKAVKIVPPPSDVAVGWDAADALSDGWTEARAVQLIAAAAPVSPPPSAPTASGNAGRRRRTPQRDTLIAAADACEFWRDANRIAYATFDVNSHQEHWPVQSREFRMWMSSQFYKETGMAIGGQALADGIRILEAKAVNEGACHEPFIRIGRQGKKLYLDLCDEHWRAVEITADGWSVVEKPGIKFLRSSAARSLVEPEAGGMIEELREFLNVRDGDFVLVVGFLVAALRDLGPYPILAVNGEQGTGKSVFSRMIRSLIDPSAAPIRAVPKDDRDLVVSAGNSWLLAFDNLSSMPAWFADALCRLATGSGFATRMLHTDRTETIFEAARPCVLNGIPSLTDRADLADRTITIHLAPIGEDVRYPEDELFAAFEAKQPRILGALLDGVSGALRNIAKVKLDRAPRMADLAKWIVAAEGSLGWEPGEFLAVYQQNRRDVIEGAFEADAVAVGIRDFVAADHPLEGWTGTATQLLASLNMRASDGTRRSKIWPVNAQALGNRLARAAPLLRNKGFVVEQHHSGQRHIIIKPPASPLPHTTHDSTS